MTHESYQHVINESLVINMLLTVETYTVHQVLGIGGLGLWETVLC
jgi:hypothetical protein